MIVLAHILGMPVEELALPWVSGGGAGIFIVLVSGIRVFALKRRPQ